MKRLFIILGLLLIPIIAYAVTELDSDNDGYIDMTKGGTDTTLADPGGDRILFWDDSAGAMTWLNPSTGLTVTGTDMTSSGSGSQTPWTSNIDTANYELQNTTGTGDVVVELGDAAGSDKFEIEDSGDVAVFTVDSDGDITGSSITITQTTNPQEMKLLEGSGGGTNYRGFTVPSTLTQDLSYELPDGNPTANDFFLIGAPSSNESALSYGGFDTFDFSISSSTVSIADDGIVESHLKAVDTAADEECLTYETTTGDFEWQACGSGGGDSIEIDSVAVVDPDFVSTGDIDFVDTSNTITANINADAVGTDELAGDLDLLTTGTVQGDIKVTNKSGNATLTASEMNGMVFVTATATITLPAVTTGTSVCVYSTTAAAVHVDANASDRIRLSGTALDDADKISSASAAGDFVCLIGDSADGWTTLGMSGTWTDGG